jgi:AraC family L-rhamnose operon regulatory protein RhaS
LNIQTSRLAMPIPIYQEHGRTYEADTCRPVVLAAESGQIVHRVLSRGQYPGRRLARNALPGVKSVGFWNADHRQDWGLDLHRNEGIELMFLESGNLGFAVDGQTFHLKASDLTVTRPWQQHSVGDPYIDAGLLHHLILDVGVRRPHQEWQWPSWIILTPADLQQLTDFLRQNEQPVWHATANVARCFQCLGAAIESDQNGSHLSIMAVQINQLFLSVIEMFRSENIRVDGSLSTTRRTVELFWADLGQNPDLVKMEWSVHGMARRCGMGVTNFIKNTKQLVNITPMQYLNHCRLNEAARLLKEQSGLSITEIALRSGFASSQYFATLFRRRFGHSPRTFRNGGT